MRHEYGEAWDLLTSRPITHRGLWAPDGAPENSLGAFQAAAAADYGIELDVQLSSDGEAMVFHDATLDRMCGVEGRLSDHTAAELQTFKLKGTDETIPTLVEALAVIGHRSLVLIEIKIAHGEVGDLEKRVSEILIDHNGPSAVIGFNPYSLAWFAKHHPQTLRGLDSYSYNDDETLARDLRQSYAALEHVPLAKPQFLVLGLDIVAKAPAAKLRSGGMPVLAWTIRGAPDWDANKAHADNMIFEGFRP